MGIVGIATADLPAGAFPVLVTAQSYDDPPRVEIYLQGLWDTTDHLTLTRTSGGETWTVRSAPQAIVPGDETGVIIDWEAPVGHDFSYTLSQIDASGGVLWSDSFDAFTIPDPGFSLIWISDPLDETTPRTAFMLAGTDAERTGDLAAQFARPAGSKYGIASYTEREQLASWPLILWSDDPDEITAISDLITPARTLCFRLPSWVTKMPPIVYGVIDRLAEIPDLDDENGDDFVWQNEIHATLGTQLPTLVYRWTYDDLPGTAATYDALLAIYPTYQELATNTFGGG